MHTLSFLAVVPSPTQFQAAHTPLPFLDSLP